MDKAKTLAQAVLKTVSSSSFNKEEIQQHELTLSQGYCLLWQDAKSGDVCGRQCGTEANGGTAAAVLVDLVVLGRAEVEVAPDSSAAEKKEDLIFKVLSQKPTSTYLDAAMFDKIMNRCDEHPKKLNSVKDWIYEDMNQNYPDHRCTTITLDSLVERGILLMQKTFCGRKYPTVKPEIEEKLVKEIRAVALDGAEPSSYIRALLTVARTADNLTCLNFDPVLRKHFSSAEYCKAKEGINALVSHDKKGIGNEEKK